MDGLIQGAMPQQAQGGGKRQADKSEQAQFELAVQQAAEFLMQDDQIDSLVDMSQKTGPAKAIALFVKKILDGVYTAGSGAGVKIAGHTMTAAAEIVAKLAATILTQGGVEGDPKQIVDEAMQLMEQM